jgi:hypothetical protein
VGHRPNMVKLGRQHPLRLKVDPKTHAFRVQFLGGSPRN